MAPSGVPCTDTQEVQSTQPSGISQTEHDSIYNITETLSCPLYITAPQGIGAVAYFVGEECWDIDLHLF